MPQLGRFQDHDSWLKGDMLYTVGFQRLDLIRLGKRGADGRREYFRNRLGWNQMRCIYHCVLQGLNLGHLEKHL